MKANPPIAETMGQAKDVATLLRTLRLQPAHGLRLIRLGHERLLANDLETAEAAARLATTLMPESADAWLLLGTLQARSRRSALAIESLRRASTLDPKSIPAWLNLAEAQLAVLDFNAAADSLKRTIKLDPQAQTSEGLRAQMLVVEILSSTSQD